MGGTGAVPTGGGGTQAGGDAVASGGEAGGMLFPLDCLAGTVHTEPFTSDPLPTFTLVAGSWTLYGLEGSYQQIDKTVIGSAWIGDRPQWTNYTVEARVRIDADSGSSGAGIVFRVADMNPGNMYYFGIRPTGATFGTIKQGAFSPLGGNSQTYYIGSWHQLHAQAQSGVLTFQVDSEASVQINDTQFAAGSIGMFTMDAAASYDWITVTCG